MSNVRITRDPAVLLGKPCVAGTRISVEYILERLEDGDDIDAIVAAHRNLTHEDVSAAIAYALEAIRREPLVSAAG